MTSTSSWPRWCLCVVELADLEAAADWVGPHGVAGLVHAGADGDDAAEGALAAGDGGDALVVDAVLEVDDDAVRLREVAHDEGGRPLGVVPLDGQEGGVERLLDALGLVELERLDRHDVVAARAAQLEAVRLHRLDVRRPLVDEGDVVAGLRQHAPDDCSRWRPAPMIPILRMAIIPSRWPDGSLIAVPGRSERCYDGAAPRRGNDSLLEC